MKLDDFKQVKMDTARHTEIKVFSVVNGRKLYEVVDTACKEYLINQDKKEAKATEKE